MFEHGEVYGASIRIIRSARIVHVLELYKLYGLEIHIGNVHVLEFYKLYALEIHIVGAEDTHRLRRK